MATTIRSNQVGRVNPGRLLEGNTFRIVFGKRISVKLFVLGHLPDLQTRENLTKRLPHLDGREQRTTFILLSRSELQTSKGTSFSCQSRPWENSKNNPVKSCGWTWVLHAIHKIFVLRPNAQELVQQLSEDRASSIWPYHLGFLDPQNKQEKKRPSAWASRAPAPGMGLSWRPARRLGRHLVAQPSALSSLAASPPLSCPPHSFHFDIIKVQLAHCLKIA